MVRLDVRDDGDLGPQLVEGAVVFVRFDDDDVALPVFRVRRDVLQDAADDDGRIEAGVFEDGRDHRGGRGLAMRAGDADAALLVDDRGQQVLAPDDLDALLASRIDFGVRAFDGGGDDDRVDTGEM